MPASVSVDSDLTQVTATFHREDPQLHTAKVLAISSSLSSSLKLEQNSGNTPTSLTVVACESDRTRADTFRLLAHASLVLGMAEKTVPPLQDNTNSTSYLSGNEPGLEILTCTRNCGYEKGSRFYNLAGKGQPLIEELQ